ncbi:sensor domain-containing diguanylate cyclase [Saccharibacillus sp. CPCC 101409]|uniref:sensor domain-containing diguanylate cyclase n=1 Tax=Saccharibacillus sp. CPCC 101409 TaxID=3058041 RepID=UPI0026719218|nr:sensor domain-containing diguanylate cyclase [Saccharibacillus sp. CPCC 101409]MDO3409354.1 sensor domain-containing diguanylate cyclase [Saccharibacillus sp. CPCC 101409]
MSEHSGKNPVEEIRRGEVSEALFPVVSRRDPSFWIQSVDIGTADFPYIEPLLKESFIDWMQQNASSSFISEAEWFLFSNEGDSVAGAPELIRRLNEEPAHAGWVALARREAVLVPARLHTGAWMQEYVTLAVPVFSRTRGEVFAVLGCAVPERLSSGMMPIVEMAARHFRTCFYQRLEYSFIHDALYTRQAGAHSLSGDSALFRMVRRLYDKFDVGGVLEELQRIVLTLHPAADCRLLMTQDYPNPNPLLNVSLLDQRKQGICTTAFMRGSVEVEHKPKPGRPERIGVALPLAGHQGIYGVLHFTLDVPPEGFNAGLLSMVSDTAGKAFENAKLYEQSNLLIRELLLINELTKRLNQNLQLSDVFSFAIQELVGIFRAEYCCILKDNPAENRFDVMACSLPELQGASFSRDYGFGGAVLRTQEPLIISDYLESGMPSRFMELSEARSMIAAPLISNGKAMGAVLLAQREHHYFSYENFKLLQMLSTHIGLALSNATLHAELQRMANRDALTGLYVRRHLDEQIHTHQLEGSKGSLLVIDIDRFKQVNDTYGHQIGDSVLQQVSAILSGSIRATDVSARWGGEELAVYFPETTLDEALIVAERIRSGVAEETRPAVTVSCGVADWAQGDASISVESLFYRADMALYQAKHSGRNRIQTAVAD